MRVLSDEDTVLGLVQFLVFGEVEIHWLPTSPGIFSGTDTQFIPWCRDQNRYFWHALYLIQRADVAAALLGRVQQLKTVRAIQSADFWSCSPPQCAFPAAECRAQPFYLLHFFGTALSCPAFFAVDSSHTCQTLL